MFVVLLILLGLPALIQIPVEANDGLTTQKQTLGAKATSCSVNNYNNFYAGPNKKVESLLVDIKRQLDEIKEALGHSQTTNTTEAFKNCAALYKAGKRSSGVYTIDPDGSGPFKAFCDQTNARGGWTVIQKRLDGSVDFFRKWNEYKHGFGDPNGEYWLGLDNINRLTKSQRSMLRVELEDTEGNTAYAEYDTFAVSSERTKYRLSLGTYSGTAGDSFASHRDMPFTTRDRDFDNFSKNCAVQYKGAWWYNNCHHSNLNGAYRHGPHSTSGDGVNWYHWKGHQYSAKKAEMKIRPVDF